MLCLPENNEVFYFNRLIPKNTDVNSFLLRYLIIGVSAGLSWYNLAKCRMRQNKQTERKRPSICFVQQWPLRSRGECYVMQLPLHPLLQTNLSHCETHSRAQNTQRNKHIIVQNILCYVMQPPLQPLPSNLSKHIVDETHSTKRI